MKRLMVSIAAATALVFAAVALSAGRPALVTQRKIAGVRLGATRAEAMSALGKPVTRSTGTYDNPGQPDDWTRLAFPKRRVALYFQSGDPHSVMITTWNARYRSAAGVGPCSSKGAVKSAYGNALVPSPKAPKGFAYIVGKHMLFVFDAAPPTSARRVTTVGIFRPDVRKNATFAALSEENCGA